LIAAYDPPGLVRSLPAGKVKIEQPVDASGKSVAEN
jgi:hypothetical protein